MGESGPQATAGSARRELGVLLALMLTALLGYSSFALRRHEVFATAGFDLGIYDQAVWHWSRFETAVSTIRRVPNLFGDHFHPTLILLAPLVRIGDLFGPGRGTQALLIGQVGVVVAAAFPIWRFARRRLPAAPSLLLVATYLVSWGLMRGIAFDVHDTCWSAFGVAFLLDAYDRKAGWRVAAWSLFLLLSREDQGLTLALLGVLAIVAKRPKEGAAMIVAGGAWFAVCIKVVIPWFDQGPFEHWEYLALAPDPAGLIALAFTRPLVLLKAFVIPRIKAKTILRAVAAFAFLPLLSPYVILLLPTFAVTLLADTPARWEPMYHYWMPAAVIGCVSATDALGRLARRFPVRSRTFASILATLALFAGVVLSREIPAEALSGRPDLALDRRMYQAGRRLLERIPSDASVSATNYALGHLSHRDSAYFLRYGSFKAPGFPPIRAEYVVVDPWSFAIAAQRRDVHPFNDPDYALETRDGNWFLFHLQSGIRPAEGFRAQSGKAEEGMSQEDLLERGTEH